MSEILKSLLVTKIVFTSVILHLNNSIAVYFFPTVFKMYLVFKMTVFQDIAPCILIDVDQHFRG
jgi:hypothetical protein